MMRMLLHGLQLPVVQGRTRLDARCWRWLPVLAVGFAVLALSPSADAATITYSSQGCSLFQVPSGITSVGITATGSAGQTPGTAGNAGGRGDEVASTLSGLAGQTLDVCVDSYGGNGANSNGGAGGGASGVALGSDFSAPVLIAAGGGGGGDESLGGGSAGASAGLPAGGTAGDSSPPLSSGHGDGGGGGTQTAVGSGGANANGGTPVTGNYGNGSAGSAPSSAGPGAGGTGGAFDVDGYGYDGGGGGAGYYGGGGGSGAGGGGGSDFCASSLPAGSLSGCGAVGTDTVYGTGSVAGTGASVELTYSGNAQPSLTLSAPSSDTPGTAISASSIAATLSGATSSASGEIKVTVFGPQASAPTDCATGGTSVGGTAATVSGPGSYSPSASFAPSKAGNYYWYASYGGDSNDSAESSVCGAAMTSTAVRAATALSLTVPSSGTAGTAISASSVTASLSGGISSPSGTVTFTVYGPQASPPTDCSTGGTTVGTTTNVSGNGTYSPGSSYTPTAAGDYYWYASYSGDYSNSASNSGCGAAVQETAVGQATIQATFSSQGCSTFNVPNKVSSIGITATGSAGQSGDTGQSGGTGDELSGTLSGLSGQTLDICIDSGGGTGGSGLSPGRPGGAGGGASGVALGSDFSAPVLVAGGGGGGTSVSGGNAGLGGDGFPAATPGVGVSGGTGGGAGTQSGVGGGGATTGGYGGNGINGSASSSAGPGAGGAGGYSYGGGGGGGAGYYGGGGGGGGGGNYGAGGGGGSDFCAATLSGASFSNCAVVGSNAQYGMASVELSYKLPTPAIHSVAEPSSATVGTVVKDQVTVDGGGGDPTGSVTFALYSNSSEAGTPLFTDTEALSGGKATSTGYTTLAPGTDYWAVSYGGDADDNPVPAGAGTPVTVTQASPSISSAADPGSVPVGGSLQDQVTVSGGDDPSGSVSFALYDNSSASGAPLFTSTAALSGGKASSGIYTATSVGTEYWVATYGGDANDKSVTSAAGGTPVVVTQASPSVSSTADPGSVTVGGSVQDQATVSGGDDPSGSVTFDLYGNSSATGTPLFTDTEQLSGGKATSAGYATAAAGTDYWVATYDGDTNNAAASSGPAADPVTVRNASPSISSSPAPGSATVGDLVTDQVTVTGGNSPSGPVTFDLYSSKTTQDGSTLVYYDTENLSGGTATAAGWTTSAPGTYYWVATYGGDGNNGSVTSAAAAAPVIVGKASPTISSSAQETSVALGGEIWDQATVSGGYSPSGSVTFNVYSSKTIQDASTLLHTDTEPLSGGSSAAAGYTTTTAGTEYWVATYDGDANNGVVSSGAAADPVTVGKASPTISSSAQPQTATAGDALTDWAVVYGNYDPSGQVTFDLYSSKTNQSPGTLLFSSTESLSSGSAVSASYTATGVGTDYWVATYGGNANNASVSTGAAADPVTIAQASPLIAITLDPASATIGETAKAEATLSGGGAPSGTVTFALYDNAAGTGTPLFASTDPVSGGTATSASYTPTTVGSDYWIATYSGDANNHSASSTPAVWEVIKATPSISTSQQPSSVTVGGAIKDEATVSGGYDPGGTVTFALYANGSRSGTPLFTSEQPLSGGTATSASYTTTASGTEYWVASYGGDTNNDAVSSGVAAAPVTVGSASSTTTTSTTAQVPPASQDGSAAKSTSTSIASSVKAPMTGQSMTYTATVTPTPDGGTVKFTDEGNLIAGCGAVPVDAGTASCRTSYARPGGGGIQAAYSGDADFNSSQSSALNELVRPSLTLLSARSTPAGGIRFKLRCAVGSGGCRVTATLTAAGVSGRPISAGVKRLVLITGAKTSTIELGSAGRKLLSGRRKLSVQLSISLTVGGQASTVATRRLTIH